MHNPLDAIDCDHQPKGRGRQDDPHFLALHGFGKLVRTIEVVAHRLNPGLRLIGVILCMYEYESGTRLAAEVTSDVEHFFQRQRAESACWADACSFRTRVRRNIRLAEAPSFGQSIFQYAPESNGAKDYRQLAREVLGLPLGAQHESLPPVGEIVEAA